MYYIGIDPSTSSTGYAVVNEKQELIDFGKIEGSADDPKSFADLYKKIADLLEKYPPKIVTCETQYFGGNSNTLIKLTRPSGVILAAVGLYETEFQFLMPSEWRKMFMNKGNASKRESYDYVLKVYPKLLKQLEPYALLKNGKVSQTRLYTHCNDITDAIGVACAGVTYLKENRYV